jgi:phage tail-like protein
MPTENATSENEPWPLPKFQFQVDFGTDLMGISFQEVSGLDLETQVIEYRKSNSPTFSTIKMPGIVKNGNITMKKGIFKNNDFFDNWHKQIDMNTITRRTVIIKLLDETGKPTMRWQLTNAWPTKITGNDLKAGGNEIAVESIEIAHEGITISNAS